MLCVMCEIINNKIEDMFIPQSCFRKNLNKCHRICSKCWWSLFAKEDAEHNCLGCKKGLKLTNVKKEVIEILD